MMFLDFIRLAEAVEIVVLILLLVYVGGQWNQPDSATRLAIRRVARGTLMLYAVAGAYRWGISSALDALVITLRACLAAGLAFGVALLVLPPVMNVWKRIKPRAKPRKPAPRPPVLTLPKPKPVSTPMPTHEQNEQKAKVSDARTEVVRFYEQHASLIQEAKPSALFRAEIETRFPADIKPADAWKATQEMIAGMLPLIAAANEKARATKAEEEQQAAEREETARKQKEDQDKAPSLQRITEWYRTEREKIETASLDEMDREEILLQLRERQDQLMKEALAEIKP